METAPVVIIGAGPAGLTAAYELVKRDLHPIVLEQADKVGGLARTEEYKGYRFDIGGHRFYTKVPEVQRLWEEVLGEAFRKVPRLSRIYYQGRFYNYPLELRNTLANLGVIESLRILLSYVHKQVWPSPEEQTFEEYVTNRFGQRLYQNFFKTYTEKVWGIPCRQIQADWAAQRIKGLSLRTALFSAIFGTNSVKSLIHEFSYPVQGPGMMWQRFREVVEQRGGQVRLNSAVVHLCHERGRIRRLVVHHEDQTSEIDSEYMISSMSLSHLLPRLDPLPPAEVIQAVQGLHYRAFILVALIVNQADLFPDNWVYIHSPDVRVGRIQNYKNWSAEMVPDPSKTCLGLEYFCSEGDAIWDMPDPELLTLATRELGLLGLADPQDVEDGVIVRQPKAYPVYDRAYREHLQVIRRYLAAFDNLHTVGRNGMHRYNNQDHSMLTGMLAVRNILGESHNLWDVNTERSYYETMTTEKGS